jgi:hypothetical protein
MSFMLGMQAVVQGYCRAAGGEGCGLGEGPARKPKAAHEVGGVPGVRVRAGGVQCQVAVLVSDGPISAVPGAGRARALETEQHGA